MRLMMVSRRLVTLVTMGVILTACGGDTDEAATTITDTLAVTTPTSGATEASSPVSEATTVASTEIADERPSTTLAQQDDQSAAVEAAPDGQPATTEAPSEEQPAEPQVTLVRETSDDALGKDIPSGPASTAPPAPPSDFDSDGDGRYTPEELERAIRSRFPEYEWPPNYQMTEGRMIEAMRFDTFPPGSMFEAPGEYTALGLMHECAWELTLIDAALEHDQELIDQSLYQLVDFGQNKNPLDNDENGKAFARDMYDRAALGDIAPLQQWVDTNCDLRRQYFITPESATPPSARRVHGEHAQSVSAPTS